MQPPIDGSVAVVTGASSGIGVEIARLLAPRVKVLILVARRKERLDDLALALTRLTNGLVVEVRPCDLSDVDAVKALSEEILADHGGVDILVNNAGFGEFDLFERSDEDKLLGMLNVNMVAVTLLTRRFLPGMVERGRGGILNTSSSFGLTWMPNFSAYLGTKHYVTSFTEALRTELLGTGVVVTQVCPGPVTTEFVEVAGNVSSHDVPAFLQIGPEQCAEAALGGFEKGKAMVIPGLGMKLLMLGAELTPRFVLRFFMGLLGRYLRLDIEGQYAVRAAQAEAASRRPGNETPL